MALTFTTLPVVLPCPIVGILSQFVVACHLFELTFTLDRTEILAMNYDLDANQLRAARILLGWDLKDSERTFRHQRKSP